MIVEDKIWSVHNLTMLGPNYMENTLLAWSVKSNTIYVGMPSINSISKNWGVLPYQCQHTNTNRYLIWPNLLEVNLHKHTCNIFLVFGWVWLTNRCGHAEWHLQTTSCKVCFLISVSVPTPISTQHGHSWQTNTNHLVIKVKVTFQAKAHQSLCIQHTDMFRIAAVFCVYWKPWCIQTYPSSPPCTGRSHMHGDSRMAMIDSRSLVTQRSTHHPPVIGTG